MEYRSRLDLCLPPRYLGHNDDSKYLSYHRNFYSPKGRSALIGAMDMMDRAYIFYQAPPVHYCCPCICTKKRHLLQAEQICKVEQATRSRRRRNRTVYTDEQTAELEEVFKGKKYLDSEEKQQLAEKLEVKTENIEIWFKNRRSKWRKQGKVKQSSSSAPKSTSTCPSHPKSVVIEGQWNQSHTQSNREIRE